MICARKITLGRAFPGSSGKPPCCQNLNKLRTSPYSGKTHFSQRSFRSHQKGAPPPKIEISIIQTQNRLIPHYRSLSWCSAVFPIPPVTARSSPGSEFHGITQLSYRATYSHGKRVKNMDEDEKRLKDVINTDNLSVTSVQNM